MKPGNQHDSFACMVPIPADYGLKDKDAFLMWFFDCFLTRMQSFVLHQKYYDILSSSREVEGLAL